MTPEEVIAKAAFKYGRARLEFESIEAQCKKVEKQLAELREKRMQKGQEITDTYNELTRLSEAYVRASDQEW